MYTFCNIDIEFKIVNCLVKKIETNKKTNTYTIYDILTLIIIKIV